MTESAYSEINKSMLQKAKERWKKGVRESGQRRDYLKGAMPRTDLKGAAVISVPMNLIEAAKAIHGTKLWIQRGEHEMAYWHEDGLLCWVDDFQEVCISENMLKDGWRIVDPGTNGGATNSE